MAEESNPSNPNNIEMNLTAYDKSQVTQIGQINAAEVKIIVERIEPILERLQQIPKVESPGVLKAGNSPKRLAYWQGRKTEIAQINQWLTDKNTFLIGIEGIGGMGKSMLAAKIYDEIEGFPKRFWGDVSNGESFSDLAREVLTEFGFPVPEQEAQLVEALVKCLRSGQFLLIIDNLESLLQPDRQWGSLFYGDFFNAWVESGGNSKVLVTTRERPELKGFEWLPLKGLQVEEGVALLTALGIRGDLGEFVELVDGHPLLLRLVADLLKEEYPQDPNLIRLADLGLGNLRQLLTDSQVVGVHRRENVGMVLVLNASFNRLNELQKALLLNISVYRGVVDSAATVAVLPGSSKPEIERELRNLVKRSLLVEKLNGKQRFEFQPVVLEYVRYKAGDRAEAHQRAIYYYLLNVKPKPWQIKEDIKEHLEVFYHWYQLEKYDAAFEILRTYYVFLKLRGYYTEQVNLCRQLIEVWKKDINRDNKKYSTALNYLGIAYRFLGNYQQSIEFHQQHLQIAREIGERNEEGAALGNLGNAYHALGQFHLAIEFYQQHLQITRETGERNGESIALGNLGNAYHALGQFQKAVELYQQHLQIAREIGDRNGQGSSLNNLGNAYRSLGQFHLAIDFLQQSLKIAREIGNRNGEGNSLAGLGLAYRYQGQFHLAIECHQQHLQIAKEIGDRNGQGIALSNLGNDYQALGQFHLAIEFHQQHLQIAKEIGAHSGEGNALGNLGNAYQALGQFHLAIEFHQQHLQIARELGDRSGEGIALGNLGAALHSQGEFYLAIEFYQESLTLAIKIGDAYGEANAWLNLGGALQNVNRKSDALGAYRNARELFQAIGIDTNVQLCNNAIERLSQPQTPVVSHRGFWGWLRRLWRWVHAWVKR
ncbi:tetratricopeptide repeat protein [Dendronalium sp. ChiSLP03b]|uniref:tetratricopeptide repeat protein n=1 Tax=Dendronalium sp. ChiSLP03b TaxID=3075381 RepID=UPI002AD2F4C0|nr:tetratricopeptide repeat protein [Dendronalium sp. ChiSLP03b]MDZ8208380.1 tetratricopeptide repeat protein [Dendronalium sp. ChiSLP03b]